MKYILIYDNHYSIKVRMALIPEHLVKTINYQQIMKKIIDNEIKPETMIDTRIVKKPFLIWVVSEMEKPKEFAIHLNEFAKKLS